MKKQIYIVIICLLGSVSSILSQKIGNLNGIYYQAVAVDDIGKEIVGMDINGKPLNKKAIGVRFTITQGIDGAIEWEETHTTNTDKYGLFTLIIGQGTPTGNSKYPRLLDIPWIDADQFLKVEISTKNDGNYKLVSNQQFMSVPYSFYTDDIADDAITTEKILDSAILNRDIHTSAVDSRTILNASIIAEDIDTGAVTTSEILDSTILNKDLMTGSVDSRTLLDSTILNKDIQTGAVDSRILLDSTILNQDLRTGAVDSRSILNGSILNEDIADSIIDLTSKVRGILPVKNGGTGTDTLLANSLIIGNTQGALLSLGQATDGQIAVGVTDSMPKLKVISGQNGVNVSVTSDSIIISSVLQAIVTSSAGTIFPGIIDPKDTWISPSILVPGVDLGSIIYGSIDANLNGLQMTFFVTEPDIIKVSFYNGTLLPVDLGFNRQVKVMVVK
ncbi:MAG: hypothetical protein IPG82_06180 [Saprospiraceae bacterium]|nr:hypothetical protein [Saprospiraceae bacterium]